MDNKKNLSDPKAEEWGKKLLLKSSDSGSDEGI